MEYASEKPPGKLPVAAARGADGSVVNTTEKGTPAPTWNVAPANGFGGPLAIPWSYFDEREESPELQWMPGNQGSNRIYAQMLGDAQTRGLLMATSNPIRRFLWTVDPNGASAAVTKEIAQAFNLPVLGKEDAPKRGGFNHDRFLAQALQALAYGHYYFERVYDQLPNGKFQLQGLYTRPPRTIINFVTNAHGALAGIVQMATGNTNPLQIGLGGIPIDANSLLPFVWEPQDDGDWVGRSMLRPIYKNWLAKDRLVRLDVLRHERNSMGVPWVETDPKASKPQVESLAVIAEEVRASQRGGGAGPGKLTMQGVTGKASDPIESIRYHDQQMTSAFLAMFIELGRAETGSYALGQALVDFHSEMIGTVADWYVATMQAQIEDQVLINWGPNEQPPRLRYTRLETAELAFEDLSLGVEKGLIAATPELRAYIGERWKVPGQTPEEIEAHEEEEAEKAAERAEQFGLPPGEGGDGEPPPEEDEAPPKAAALQQPQRSALADAMLAEVGKRGALTWPALAEAVGSDRRNGTARRARDLLVAQGALVEMKNGRTKTLDLGANVAPDHPERVSRANPRAALASTIGKYGLTLADFDRMLAEQAGRCAVCAVPLENPNVDHCHDHGHVRGLLCRSCNLAAGQAGDDPTRLRGLADYLANKVPASAGLQLPDRELHRLPRPFEVSAAVDFAQMERVYVDNRTNLVSAVKAAQGAQIAELAAAVEAAGGNVAKLGTLQVAPIDTAVLMPALLQAARDGEASAQQEYEAQVQGDVPVTAAQPSKAKVDAKAEERARAAALTLAMGLATSASTKATQISTLAPDAAAAQVTEHLQGLSDATLNARLGGAVQGSYNAGRFEVIRARGPENIYASEIMDSNTCSPCSSEDGSEFPNMDEAETAYPGSGGYVECEGADRCRGTLVAVYA